MRYFSLYLDIYFYLCSKCCFSCRSSFTYVNDAVCLFVFSCLFLAFVKCCVSCCSIISNFFDSVFLSLFSYLCLPCFQVLVTFVLFFYSCRLCGISLFVYLFISTCLSSSVYLFAPLLLIYLVLYVCRFLAIYVYLFEVLFICLLILYSCL